MMLLRPQSRARRLLVRFPAIRFLAPAILVTVAIVRYRLEHDRWWATLIMATIWAVVGTLAIRHDRRGLDEVLDLTDDPDTAAPGAVDPAPLPTSPDIGFES